MSTKTVLFIDTDCYNNVVSYYRRVNGSFKDENRIFEFKDWKIFLDDTNGSYSISDFDVGIIKIKHHWYNETDKHASHSKNVVRRKQEIFNSLDQGKKVILLVEKFDSLLKTVLKDINIKLDETEDHLITSLKTNLNQFEQFVKKHCQFTGSYSGKDLIPICSYQEKVCGFYVEISKGTLFILPTLIKEYNMDFFIELLSNLLETIFSLSGDNEIKLPEYLSNMRIVDESELMDKNNQLQQEIIKINKELYDIKRIKSVLSSKHELLRLNTIFVLEKIGLNCNSVDNLKEDGWILQDSQKKIMIEVKGTTGNFTRKFLGDIDAHREENHLNDDFPAFLIVNTFSDSDSIEEKDISPDRDIINRANVMKIKIMRTLDLFNIFLLISTQKEKAENFLSMIESSGGGWIKVADKIELIN